MAIHDFSKTSTALAILRESSLISAEPLLKAEAICLVVATPFLLLPTFLSSVSWVCAILLVVIWLAQRVIKGQLIVPLSPLSMCWYMLGGMVLVGVAVSAEMALTLPEVSGLLLGFAWWRLITLITRTKADIAISTLIFFTAAVAITLVGLVSMEWPDKVSWLIPLTSLLTDGLVRLPDQTTRAPINANLVAAALLLYLPLVLSLTVEIPLRRRGQLMAGILASFILLFIELLTQSRAGWIATLFGLLVLYAMKRGRRRMHWWTKQNKGWFVVGLFVCGLLFVTRLDVAALQNAWSEPPTETGVGSLHTLSFRQEMWRWGAVAVSDYPFTGVGFGTFRSVVQRQYPIAVPITYDVGHAHNVYLQIALDIGLPGLIAYLAMMLICCWMCMQLMRRDAQQRAIGQGIFACLVAFHVWGLTDTLPLGSKPGLIFWMMLGLLTGIYVSSKRACDPLFSS